MTKITLGLAAVAALLVCDAATGQEVRGGALRPIDRLRLANAGADATRLRIDLRHDRRVRRLSGDLGLRGSDRTSRLFDLRQRYGALFGDDGRVGYAAPRELSRRHTRLDQSVHGFRVEGHGLTVRFDGDGRATDVHGVLSREAARLAPPVLDQSQGREHALDHLASLGHAPDELRAPPVVEGVALLSPAPVLVWRSSVVLRDGFVPLVIDVAADDGRVLRVREARSFGTGTFAFDGVDLEFSTGKGTGSQYKKVSSAASGTEAGSSLAELGQEDIEPSAAVDGMLTGRWGQVTDASGLAIVSPDYTYAFADDDFGLVSGIVEAYELFDHANTYAWVQRMGAFANKLFDDGSPIDRSLPVLVNYDDGEEGYVNAFFSPLDLDGAGGFGDGYFVFGDFDEVTGNPMHDLSRDPTVVCHEYVHGLVDGMGATFGDADLDYPPRAVNEALADYGSASFLKEPRIGYPFLLHAGDDLGMTEEALRDLEDELTLIDDVLDTINPGTGLPEEHEAGAIFGSYLWRARRALKAKTADRLFLGEALLDWPQGTAEVGFPVVDALNAEDAYRAYFTACAQTTLDALVLDENVKAAGRLLSAAMSHGLLGHESLSPVGFDATEGLKLTLQGAFLGSLDEHQVALDLAAGQTLTLTIKKDKGDDTTVDFACDDDPGDFTFQAEKKTNADGTKASQSKILVNVPGTYVLSLLDTSGAGGAYKATVKVK